MGISHHPYAALPTNVPAGEETLHTHALVSKYLRGRSKRGEIAAKTAKTQWSTLHQFADVAPDPARITRRTIRTWQESYDYLAQSTKRNRLTIVRAFVTWLRDEGHLRGDPMRQVPPLKEPKRLPRALPPEQVTLILEACPDLRAQLATILMVQLGLRRGEVARLEVGSFDLTNRLVHVTGKGGKERVLWLTEEAKTILLRYLTQTGATAGPLLRSYQFPQRGLHEDTVSTIVRRAMEDAGVKKAPRDGVNPHALRHSCLTDMLRAGAHLRDVQAVAGHSALQTTEIYLPLMVGTLEEAMEGRTYTDVAQDVLAAGDVT